MLEALSPLARATVIGEARSGLLPDTVRQWIELNASVFSRTIRGASDIRADLRNAAWLREARESGHVPEGLQRLITESIGLDAAANQARIAEQQQQQGGAGESQAAARSSTDSTSAINLLDPEAEMEMSFSLEAGRPSGNSDLQEDDDAAIAPVIVGAPPAEGTPSHPGDTIAPTAPWQPLPNFQKPAPHRGRFLGEVGNSDFALSDVQADEMGLPRGTTIPWVRGIPDFRAHAVPGTNGFPAIFNVPGLTGIHDVDKRKMIRYITEQTGMTPAAVKEWLADSPVELHHSGGDSGQIVPEKVHWLHHSGGSLELRQRK